MLGPIPIEATDLFIIYSQVNCFIGVIYFFSATERFLILHCVVVCKLTMTICLLHSVVVIMIVILVL